MRESVLLSQIAEAARGGFPGRPDVLVGPGDDCAVVRTPGGEDLLLTVDQCVEGAHFRPDRPLRDIARSAMGRAVSDIASMGGRPRWALASATLGGAFDQERASELFDEMAACALRWGCPLIGGDIAIHEGATVLSVTVIGAPHPERGPVLRSGARAGDVVCVTGPLGGAAASGWTRIPAPRVETGVRLCDALGADLHAMIDISDGLGRDAARIAERSGVLIELDAAAIPLAPGVEGWGAAVSGGEDYELCFTCPAPPPADLGCTVVGAVKSGAGCKVVNPDGETLDASDLGWDHHSQ